MKLFISKFSTTATSTGYFSNRSEGCTSAVLVAVERPSRTRRLVLCASVVTVYAYTGSSECLGTPFARRLGLAVLCPHR